MTFDAIESNAFGKSGFNVSEQLNKLHAGFDNTVSAVNGAYENISSSATDNIAKWIGEEGAVNINATSVYDTVKQMYSGTETPSGKNTLGLKEIGNWKTNKDYYDQNIKQQSGYAAEVISTAKENTRAQLDGSGITTYRADDRPDLGFAKNDQYVDKIRVDANGNIIERVQSKFVGDNGAECLDKLTSSDYDKYFEGDHVDKIEVPSDYYDDIKALIPDKIAKLEEQVEKTKELGKDDVAAKKQAKIDRLKQIDQMVEKSTVSRDEAIYAREHPKRYFAKVMAKEVATTSHMEGLESAKQAAALTAAVSTVDNVQKVMSGEITPEDAVKDIAKDTATAGAVGYATTFVSSAVATSMSASSHALIKSIGNSGVPAMAVTFAVSSYDSVIDYAQGTIDESELAVDLGQNAANVAGGALGSAIAGAAVGSIVPGAGTAVGFVAGMAGGMVGTAVASEAYTTALEYGPEVAQGFADKAQEMATQTVEVAQKYVPNKVESIKTALNTYINTNNLPIKI